MWLHEIRLDIRSPWTGYLVRRTYQPSQKEREREAFDLWEPGINCVQLCGHPFNAAFVTPSVRSIVRSTGGKRTESSVERAILRVTSVSGLQVCCKGEKERERKRNAVLHASWERFDGLLRVKQWNRMFFSSMSIPEFFQIFWEFRIIRNIDVNVNDSAGKLPMDGQFSRLYTKKKQTFIRMLYERSLKF